jgi:hypothetical protein
VNISNTKTAVIPNASKGRWRQDQIEGRIGVAPWREG